MLILTRVTITTTSLIINNNNNTIFDYLVMAYFLGTHCRCSPAGLKGLVAFKNRHTSTQG